MVDIATLGMFVKAGRAGGSVSQGGGLIGKIPDGYQETKPKITIKVTDVSLVSEKLDPFIKLKE